MGNQEIISLTDEKVPTIVSYSNEAQVHIIGSAARITGLKGKTTVFNFKPDIGKGDAEYSKEKKYWCYLAPAEKQKEIIETYTAKEATMHFLKALLKDVDLPDQVLIGEPAIREQAWRENFRRHIREIFKEMDIGVTPKFFSEPFAVFQYYRNEFFPKTSKSEIVLVIDIGGGTFNTCIIKTTDEGYLSRGGGTNVPLGLQADVCGGREIDKGLLEIVIKKAQKQGIVWKENPMYRAESGKSPVMLHIEDAKIKLSDSIGTEARLAENHSKVKVDVNFSKGMLHTEFDINVELTGEDLKKIIRQIWRKKYGSIIIKTLNEAKKQLNKLKFKLEKLDKVIVAGGSSRLPFTKEEIHTVLPTRIKSDDIFVAPYLGKAVAAGLAYECLEQIKKRPELSVGNIAPCLLNELYLGFRKSRRSPIITPKVKFGGSKINTGQLISEPFVIENFKLTYELEMPFELSNQVFYCFCDQPFQEDEENIPLNLSNDVFSLGTDNKIIKKWTLEIEINKNGMIKPVFIFKEKGKGAKKEGNRVSLPEFPLTNFNLQEGDFYVGIDFGTSNSYVVQFMKPVDIDSEIEYPTLDVIPATLDKLRELEKEILDYKASAMLAEKNIIKYSLDQMLLLVFHSNKIEGNPLTKGETEIVFRKNDPSGLSKGEREAYNLERAYKWMLDNYNACIEEPEGLIRTLNRMILDGTSQGGGEYRLKPVKISGMDFRPPISSAVPSFMEKLAGELKEGASGRSIIEFAATMHTKLVAIHPFIDGNGRTARLLMNAILLKYNLPPIIVNFADKQRYLTTLSASNKGNVSPLIEFLMECFYETFEDFKNRFTDSGELIKEKPLEEELEAEELEGEKDPIKEALLEVSVKRIDDPIKMVMHPKIQRQKRILKANYESWKKSFSFFLYEFTSIIDEFNSNDEYRIAGFRMKVFEYDMLSYEKYTDICHGKKVSRTWFHGVEIAGSTGREQILFFFVPCRKRHLENKTLSPVSLIIARSEDSSYRILESEPISLREIGYSDGELIFFHSSGEIKTGEVRMTIKTMLAEVIRSYL